MKENPKKFFVGIPKEFFLKSPGNFFLENTERFFRKVQEDFSEIIFRESKKNFQEDSKVNYIKPSKINFSKFGNKTVTKDSDPTRVKRVELSNKDKLRSVLETQAHFPHQPSFLEVLRKTILDYFLPFPPPPPLEDPRNIFPENKNGSEKE